MRIRESSPALVVGTIDRENGFSLAGFCRRKKTLASEELTKLSKLSALQNCTTIYKYVSLAS